jgi:hypothetical protein
MGYARGYPAILGLGRRTNWTDPDEVLAVAYAAYGWMPTILTAPPRDQLAALGAFILTFPADELPRADLADRLGRAAAAGTLLTINRSAIGTSKLLHFARPRLFPIWDSIVAARFGFRAGQQVHNRAEEYAAYTLAVHRWIEQNPERLARLRAASAWMQEACPDPLSDVRLVEAALFR